MRSSVSKLNPKIVHKFDRFGEKNIDAFCFLVFLYFYYWCFLPSFTPTYIGTMSVSHKSTDFETILQSDMRSPCWSPSDFSSQNWSVPLLLIGCWATDHLPLGAKAFTHQQWAVHYRVIISTGHQWRSARAYWLDQSKPSRAGATGWSWWNYFGPIPPQYRSCIPHCSNTTQPRFSLLLSIVG